MWVPCIPDIEDEEEVKNKIYKLLIILEKLNIKLYDEIAKRRSLVKCMRLIKKKEMLRKEMEKVDQKRNEIKKQIKRNEGAMENMAYCHLF